MVTVYIMEGKGCLTDVRHLIPPKVTIPPLYIPAQIEPDGERLIAPSAYIPRGGQSYAPLFSAESHDHQLATVSSPTTLQS